VVIDTSAIIAALDGPQFFAALVAAVAPAMSALTAYECRIVLGRARGVGKVQDFDLLMQRLAVEIVPFDAVQALAAHEACVKYGRGSGAKAQLNLCDCAAYALARTRDEPLLFKGDDFLQTDIAPAL